MDLAFKIHIVGREGFAFGGTAHMKNIGFVSSA